MRSVFGLLGLIATVAIILFLYKSYFTGATGEAVTLGSNNPRAVADVAGVRNDLLSMAQAERAYMALNGHYASLDDLHSTGDLTIDPNRGRLGYTYSAEIQDRTFVITATYSGPATGMPSLSIDESMQVTQQ